MTKINESEERSLVELREDEIATLMKCVDMSWRVWYSWYESKTLPEGVTEEFATQEMNNIMMLEQKLAEVFNIKFVSHDEKEEENEQTNS